MTHPCSHAKPVFGCAGCIAKTAGWWCPTCTRANVGRYCGGCQRDSEGRWPKCECGHTLKKHGPTGCPVMTAQKQKLTGEQRKALRGAPPIVYAKAKTRCACRVGVKPPTEAAS